MMCTLHSSFNSITTAVHSLQRCAVCFICYKLHISQYRGDRNILCSIDIVVTDAVVVAASREGRALT